MKDSNANVFRERPRAAMVSRIHRVSAATDREVPVSVRERLVALYYRVWPSHLFGELLTKQWMGSVIPFTFLVAALVLASTMVPGYLAPATLANTSRQFGEQGLVALGFAAVVIAGGIDLSVGAVFGLVNLTVLILIGPAHWPVGAAIAAGLALGVLTGALNGALIGGLRLRAFLTTLVTLVLFRSLIDVLILRYGTAVAATPVESPFWTWLGEGDVLGVPPNIAALGVLAIVCHIALSRSKPGWHLLAIGGSRRAAHNAGISVRWAQFLAYVFSGLIVALAAVFYAARVANQDYTVGEGLEFVILTGLVLGGVSLGGGRGSVARALMGVLTVFVVINVLVRSGVSSGSANIAVGLMLAFAVFIDGKYQKNRHKLIDRVYVSPTYLRLPPMQDSHVGAGTPVEQNDALRPAVPIGLNEVEGPEDVILDSHDNLYCGTRMGDLLRFSGPNFEHREVFVHVGGRPCGLAIDRDGNIVTCVAGIGLYSVAPDRKLTKLTDETNRSWRSVVDDSRLSLPDDLDIARDGRIFFSEATVRYDVHNWPTDSLEGRGNGRIICYDPSRKRTHTVASGLVFPNGIAMCPDGVSFLFAETWATRVSRYYFDGPKKGRIERVIEDLPGYPDNINRASDGNYWVALVGTRTPTMDLAMRMPGFRKRMVRRLTGDEWLYPNLNTGCIVKIDESGRVLGSMWDLGGEGHPLISSMCEHKGWLFIGGVNNNRVGRLMLEGTDPGWVNHEAWWGSR